MNARGSSVVHFGTGLSVADGARLNDRRSGPKHTRNPNSPAPSSRVRSAVQLAEERVGRGRHAMQAVGGFLAGAELGDPGVEDLCAGDELRRQVAQRPVACHLETFHLCRAA